jgi:hypothetical protein
VPLLWIAPGVILGIDIGADHAGGGENGLAPSAKRPPVISPDSVSPVLRSASSPANPAAQVHSRYRRRIGSTAPEAVLVDYDPAGVDKTADAARDNGLASARLLAMAVQTNR